MKLRALTVADLAACHALFRQAVLALAGGVYSAEQCAAWAGPDQWTDELACGWTSRLEHAWGVCLCTGQGQLAGFAWLCHDGEFDMLFVAPWAQRQGWAGRMVRELEQQAADAGMLTLHVWASKASRPVFERAGFQFVRNNTIHRQGVRLDNVLLQKGGWQEVGTMNNTSEVKLEKS